MNPLVTIYFSLASSGITVSVILYVAWSSFGRPAHARTWAIGSALAAAGWIVGFVGVAGNHDRLWYGQIASLLMMASRALMLAGYRQRAGLPARYGAIALIMAPVAATVLASGFLRDGVLLIDVPVLGFGCLCLAACLQILLRKGGESTAADRTAAVIVALSGCFFFSAAMISLITSPLHSRHASDLFLLFMMFGLPASFISNGFACVLLLASDLAERMRALADTDPLTGALNRRGLDQMIAPTIANSRRRGEPIALVVADLDRFKAINDQLGHSAGDEVLKRFAAYVKREIRAGDLFARLGGEEFAIVLPGASCAVATEVIDRLRRAVPALCVEAIAPLTLTASFGISAIEPADDDLPSAFERADRALYASKLAGRNRVTVADEPRIGGVPAPALAG